MYFGYEHVTVAESDIEKNEHLRFEDSSSYNTDVKWGTFNVLYATHGNVTNVALHLHVKMIIHLLSSFTMAS
jgi:hypothetical protein